MPKIICTGMDSRSRLRTRKVHSGAASTLMALHGSVPCPAVTSNPLKQPIQSHLTYFSVLTAKRRTYL